MRCAEALASQRTFPGTNAVFLHDLHFYIVAHPFYMRDPAKYACDFTGFLGFRCFDFRSHLLIKRVHYVSHGAWCGYQSARCSASESRATTALRPKVAIKGRYFGISMIFQAEDAILHVSTFLRPRVADSVSPQVINSSRSGAAGFGSHGSKLQLPTFNMK